mgnify:CR=1 FL=1
MHTRLCIVGKLLEGEAENPRCFVPLGANIDLTINEAVAEARSIQPREAEHGKEETEVEKDKHHR